MNTVSRREFSRMVAALAAGSGMAAAFGAEAPRSLPEYDGPWNSLFNGRNFDGWTFFQAGVGNTDTTQAIVIERGVIHMLGPRHTGGDRP